MYELLRRRCQLIIVVDAEPDPEMCFSAFVALQRIARIDLGVVMSVPWVDIRDTSLRFISRNREERRSAAPGSPPWPPLCNR